MKIYPNFSAFPTALQIDASKPNSSKVGAYQRGGPGVLQANGGESGGARLDLKLRIHSLRNDLRSMPSGNARSWVELHIDVLDIQIRNLVSPVRGA